MLDLGTCEYYEYKSKCAVINFIGLSVQDDTRFLDAQC